MGYTPRSNRFITMTVPGVLAVGATPARWYNRTGIPIGIRGGGISVGQAPTGSAIIADVNLDGLTLFTTQANRPQIAIGAVASALIIPAVVTIPIDSYLSVDVDQIGSSTAGADLVVQVMF